MTTRVTEGARGDAFFFSSRAAALRLSRLPLTKYEEKVRLLAVCINSFFCYFYLSSVDAFVDTVFIV